jgi:hypothetical protein
MNAQTGYNHASAVLEEQVEGPMSFVVGVNTKPPAAAILGIPSNTQPPQDVDPAIRWAVATLIVYDDRNHNNMLDLVAPGLSSPDRILGAASEYDLFFLAQGRFAPADQLGNYPTATGFSLVHEPAWRDPKPYDCDDVNGDQIYTYQCEQQQGAAGPLDLGTSSVQVTLTNSDPLQRYACQSFFGDHDYPDWLVDSAPSCFGTQCALDLPPAGLPRLCSGDVQPEYLCCSGDGLAYAYKTNCTKRMELCGNNVCHFGHGARVATAPVPAGWPCP